MALTVRYPIDVNQLNELSDMGYTSLTLWSSNFPEGPYANTGATVNYTIAQSIAALDYVFTFESSGSTAGQWFKVRAFNGSSYSELSDASPFPGGGGVTLAYVRRRLGLFINDMIAAQTTAVGDANTAICTSVEVARLNDDELNGWVFHRLDDNGMALVSDFIKATGTIELGTNLTTLGSGVAFEVTRRFLPSDYRQAINDAISSSYPLLNRTIVHTGNLTAEDVYEYQIPHDIRTVSKVELEDITYAATEGHPWRETNWVAVKDGLIRKIEFKRQQPYVAGARRIRITGIGPLEQLYNDTDTVSIDENQVDLLVYRAAFHLYSKLPARAASTDREFYQEMAKFYLSLYDANKVSSGSGRPPRRNWGPIGRWGRRGT